MRLGTKAIRHFCRVVMKVKETYITTVANRGPC